MEVVQTKFKQGKYLRPVQLVYTGERIEFHFKYNKGLIAEVKTMEGARYHGFDKINPRKIWDVKDSYRNRFQIAYLEGKNPYEFYDKELIEYETTRSLYSHQLLQVRFVLTRRHCIIAAEMGTGKTLSAIEVMEAVIGAEGTDEAWYVGPKSGVKAVNLELIKWQSKVKPLMMTYEGLVKKSKLWRPGQPMG